MDEREIQLCWRKRIQPKVFHSAVSSLSPTTVFLGGQPGAGKTRTQSILTNILIDDVIVPIVGDDLRAFHPNYEDLVTHDPLRMPELTAQASARWIALCVAYANDQRISSLIEGTWRRSKIVLDEARIAKECGRLTHAVIVAVPPLLSLAGIAERFYRDRLAGDDARWTPPEAHDEAVCNLPSVVEEIISSSVIDRFSVATRDGKFLYDGMPSKEALDTFLEQFTRPLTMQEITFLEGIQPLLSEGHQRFTSHSPAAEQLHQRLLIASNGGEKEDRSRHRITWRDTPMF